MLAFLLRKPTQFDSPFFTWLHTNRSDLPIVVFYWHPVGMHADTETGNSLNWGFDLLAGYLWHQADPLHQASFSEKLRQYRVTYLVSNGWKEGFAPLLNVVHGLGIPCGLRVDSVLWERNPVEMWTRKWLLGYAYKNFNHFFSSGKVGDDYLKTIKIPSSKIRRWPYCIDVDYFLPTPQRLKDAEILRQQYGLDDRPILLSVCKWVPRENPLELLNAFLTMENSGLQLVMIGDGTLRVQMESLRQSRPELSINFPGYVSYSSLPIWMHLAQIFIHPAQYEPWGVSLHEALAAGCSLVASNRVGSAYDLIQTGKNGYTYTVGDVTALQVALKKALTLSPEKVQHTNQAILKQWNYAAIAHNFENLEG